MAGSSKNDPDRIATRMFTFAMFVACGFAGLILALMTLTHS